MSDDDCDIFNLPVSRVKVVPRKQFMPVQEPKQADYDFICTSHEEKPAKLSKTKSKTKSIKKKNTDDEDESNNNTQDISLMSPTVTLDTPTRNLSPVSKLIYEMEQKKDKAKAKELDALPVARRTRRSLGNRKTTSVNDKESRISVSVSPPKKRNTRGRKAAGNKTGTAENKTTRNRRQAAATHATDVISLDSDDEVVTAVDEEQIATDNYFEDDNPIVEINLNWQSEFQQYKLRQHQKFSHMFKEISKRNGVPVDDIIINMDDLFITPNESPQSVGLKVFHILSGSAMKSNKVNPVQKEITKHKFQLKIQGDKWKHPLIISMKKTETFKILYIKCAEEMECDVHDIKLYFDGELLDPNETPKDQEMEGNEMIDLR